MSTNSPSPLDSDGIVREIDTIGVALTEVSDVLRRAKLSEVSDVLDEALRRLANVRAAVDSALPQSAT